MIAYGYKWDSKSEFPDQLREASVVCTKEELKQLIMFLNDIYNEISDLEETDGDHWHFRDWSEEWSERQSDFIVFMTNEN